MKNHFYLFITLLISSVCYSQELKRDLAIRDTVCTVTFQKSDGVNRICVSGSRDTVCLSRNNIDNGIFLSTVKQALKNLELIDSVQVSQYDNAILNLYEFFIKKEAATDFWDNNMEYIGLTEEEVTKLKKDLVTLQNYNRYYRIYKANRTENNNYNVKAQNYIQQQQQQKQQRAGETPPAQNQQLDSLILNRKFLRRDVKELFRKRKYGVALIGNANVVSSFKTVDKTQINAGFGLSASRKGSNGFGPFASEFLGIITVAQSNDTVKSLFPNDFGQSVLVPGVRRFSLLTSFRQTSIAPLSGSSFLRKIGMAFNANVTPYQWIIPSKLDENKDSLTAKVLPVALDLMFPFTWMYYSDKNNDIYIATDFGISVRYIGGNINGDGRTSFLGLSKQLYAGAIAGLTFRYNGLRAQFHCPILFGKQVQGLTNGQAYASIGLVTDIVSDIKNILKPKKEGAAETP